jgi:hypothetical protein
MCEDVKYTKKELRKILDTRIEVINKDNLIIMDVSFLAIYSLVRFCEMEEVIDLDGIKILIKPNPKR